MMEVEDYRSGEKSARSVIDNWRLAETHELDHFARAGFPVRIQSIHEVGQLLDTMQENRYELFLKELGGLYSDEIERLGSALVDSIKFQLARLPKRQAIVPLSTMISSLVLYKKIVGFNPKVESILEVGPGCGYLSYFLARHPPLKDYSQVEACESFYILQNMVNSHLFGHRFREFAISTGEDRSINLRKDVDKRLTIALDGRALYKCFHFPWWTLNMLYEGQRKYDVVTSNANLNEFTRNALHDYLAIFSRVMKDDGIFLVQCTGAPAHGSLEELFDVLHASRFAPLFCALAWNNVTPEMHGSMAECFVDRGFGQKVFVLNNLLLVKESHPLFSTAYDRKSYRHGFAADFPQLEAMYKANLDGRYCSREELVSVMERLAGQYMY